MNAFTDDRAVVRLQRRLAASPERVYRAWLDPKMICRWLAPGGIEVSRAEVEEQVGGHYRIWHRDHRGEVGGFECELIDLLPAQLLVFRWGFVGPERNAGPVFDSLLRITLQPTPDGTTDLTLVHERLDDLRAAMPEVADAVGTGWGLALENLAGALSA